MTIDDDLHRWTSDGTPEGFTSAAQALAQRTGLSYEECRRAVEQAWAAYGPPPQRCDGSCKRTRWSGPYWAEAVSDGRHFPRVVMHTCEMSRS